VGDIGGSIMAAVSCTGQHSGQRCISRVTSWPGHLISACTLDIPHSRGVAFIPISIQL